jgi:hypothetical protein
MKASALTEKLLADRAAVKAKPKYKPTLCHACGRSYVYRAPFGDDSGRFCSTRCREAYDAGSPAYDPDYADKENPRWYDLSIGPRGFFIDCAGCRRSFISIGLRCCSEACERKVCNREDGKIAKTRGCAFCGRRIPKARGNHAKFCKDDCRAANRRKTREMATDSPTPVNGTIEASFSQ